MLINFLMLKPHVFHGSESEDVEECFQDLYERLHQLGILHRYGVALMNFQLKGGEI